MNQNSTNNEISVEAICNKYKDKYICIKGTERFHNGSAFKKGIIIAVYNTLDDCSRHLEEIKYFKTIYKSSFDVVYGDYSDYVFTRKVPESELEINKSTSDNKVMQQCDIDILINQMLSATYYY
jgi:hypothetical protein